MTAFERRLAQRQEELDWLYMELYDNREGLAALKEMMAGLYAQRSLGLRRLDGRREKDPQWFRRGDRLRGDSLLGGQEVRSFQSVVDFFAGIDR